MIWLMYYLVGAVAIVMLGLWRAAKPEPDISDPIVDLFFPHMMVAMTWPVTVPGLVFWKLFLWLRRETEDKPEPEDPPPEPRGPYR